ncbi:MAG: alpha/beta fold hydrolase [Anaerolineales bacterium]
MSVGLHPSTTERRITLSHEIHGSHGPLVLMLHGLGSRGEDWVLQIEPLQDEYRLVTPDLRGHGTSPSPSGWPTFRDLAADVSGLLLHLGERRAHVVGLSLGGGVALQMCVDFPEQVESLTIVNAAATLRVPFRRLPSAFVRLALLLTGRRRRLGEWVAASLFPREDQLQLREVAAERIAENLRLNYFKAITAVLRFDLRKQVHLIEAPTLVVAGKLDDTVPLRPKVALARAILGARLEVIEDSGHATPLDTPVEFNRILLEFLREQTAK